SERYLKRRRGVGWRCHLIAGLYHFELSFSTS
ncbi:MAG: IS5/IS1182 family transposase, partial [Cyanobacteria bacterium QH_6_48_35]